MTAKDPFADRFTSSVATENGVIEVFDSELQLLWREQPESEGEMTKFTWPEALALAWRRSEHSAHNWRLPTVEELSSLLSVDENSGEVRRPQWFKVGKEVDTDIYWTSSPVAGDADHAWLVNFDNGDVNHNHHDNQYRVRLVRQSVGGGER